VGKRLCVIKVCVKSLYVSPFVCGGLSVFLSVCLLVFFLLVCRLVWVDFCIIIRLSKSIKQVFTLWLYFSFYNGALGMQRVNLMNRKLKPDLRKYVPFTKALTQVYF